MDGLPPVIEDAARMHAAGERGRFRGLGELEVRLERAACAEARAWRLALSAQRWLAQPERGVLPRAPALARFAGESPEARRAAGLACAHATRAAWLACDHASLVEFVDAHAGLADASEGRRLAGESWRALVEGDASGVEGAAVRIAAHAQELRDASLLLEAAALRAAAALSEHREEDARKLARRASRMARTEAIPQQEYLVNLLLSRVRRRSGKPHLAMRILTGLFRVAPRPWIPRLSWELGLCQGFEGTPVPDPSDERPSARAVHALAQAIEAAKRGDRALFEHSMQAAHAHVGRFGQPERDLTTVRKLVDSSAPFEPSESVAPFLTGSTDPVPEGLAGLGMDSDGAECAFVLGVPGETGRRVLGKGVPLARMTTGARALPPTKGRQARTESTLASLVLAGPSGIHEDELFRSIYGFEYEPELHQGVRNVLFHRVRERVKSVAQLERSRGVACLVLEAPLLVPDPRCSPPPEHEVLRVIARWGHASARKAAERLGIPIRTAQAVLRRLAEDGACRVEKHGRRFEYHLEDTTYAEPTNL